MPSIFDHVVTRRGSASYKWDSDSDEQMLPMWVADMDFPTAPAIISALEKRVRHGVFGYTKIPASYPQAVIDWFATRHGLALDADWILPVRGVVPALSAVIRALTSAGTGVIIQPPVYNCFYTSIRNMQCEVVESPLILHAGRYTIDFEDLERKAAEPSNKLMLLCNPHNPVGRTWSREELTRVGEVCMAHGVTVISDEIHCDLVMPGHRHIPYSSLGREHARRSVSCASPSKAFNLAGLHVANVIAAEPEIRKRIDRALNVHEVGEIGPLAVEGLIAAYTRGGPWLDSLREYLHANYRHLKRYLAQHLQQLAVMPMEATYLAWIDCRKLGVSTKELTERLCEAHLRVSPGTLYGEAGEGFIRINLACPRRTLDEGLDRLTRTLTRI